MMLFAMPDRQKDMLATIAAEYQATAYLTGRSQLQLRIMQAMAEVPRRHFVPLAMKSMAYANRPLPIGAGQTISQPYIVALMTDLLNPLPEQKILEIGTGCGYQTAILAQLAGKIFSIEIIDSLAEKAARNLVSCRNIELKAGDGYLGWSEQAPFDGIMVTAAVSHVPEALRQQLKIGGRLVIPIGLPYQHQELMLIERLDEEQFNSESILGVAFVPLVRKSESAGKNNSRAIDANGGGKDLES